MEYINLNGEILPENTTGSAYSNRAFRYGYGLFETMLVCNGAIELEAYHWERLAAGMQQLSFSIAPSMSQEWLREEVLRCIARNKMGDLCRVRLQIFAGAGGLYDGENIQPQYLIECFTLSPDVLLLNEKGLTAGIAVGLQKSPDTLANLKTSNALIYAMAAQQATANGWNDALLCNSSGQIIESTIANLFWIKDGRLYTPPLTDGCIAGVMRRHIMAQQHVIEKSLTLERLYAADEIFVTNAIRRLRWVGSVGAVRFESAAVRKLYRTLWD